MQTTSVFFDHSTQLAVLKIMTLIKESTEALRKALVKICCSKVMRQQLSVEVMAAGLSSLEPTHKNPPTIR